jgi:hypothetical protein
VPNPLTNIWKCPLLVQADSPSDEIIIGAVYQEVIPIAASVEAPPPARLVKPNHPRYFSSSVPASYL